MSLYFPHAHFLHCYAHQFNLVIKNMCLDTPLVRIFFANVSGFSSFFSVSPERSDLLRQICSRRLPACAPTRWNFQSRVVQGVSEIRSELIECFNGIQSSPVWDERFGTKMVSFRFFLLFSPQYSITWMYYTAHCSQG